MASGKRPGDELKWIADGPSQAGLPLGVATSPTARLRSGSLFLAGRSHFVLVLLVLGAWDYFRPAPTTYDLSAF